MFDIQLLLGRYDHDHSFSFQPGHLFNFAMINHGLGEFQEDQFALFLIYYGTSFKKHINFHFGPILKEFDGMIQLKVKIMVIGIRAKAYLLDNDLRRFGLHFLLFLLQFIKEFLVVHYFTNRRVGGR